MLDAACVVVQGQSIFKGVPRGLICQQTDESASAWSWMLMGLTMRGWHLLSSKTRMIPEPYIHARTLIVTLPVHGLQATADKLVTQEPCLGSTSIAACDGSTAQHTYVCRVGIVFVRRGFHRICTSRVSEPMRVRLADGGEPLIVQVVTHMYIEQCHSPGPYVRRLCIWVWVYVSVVK